jgi:MoaA/NifB/PqqE/SkfB family radical SAM enzyme
MRYAHKNITHIHFEPTQRCQAECPMCDRTNNPHLSNIDVTVDDFKKMVDVDFVKQLNSLIMCGNHGDPIICLDTIPIFEYLRSNNPNMYLHMTTNGGARSRKWWKELAKVFDGKGKVTFSVDGLEDTNHFYRVNVNWNKIEDSMDAYTQAGGKGQWVFLIFNHNEHQVEDAERLAKLFGLEFIKKKSGRWVQSYKNKKIDFKRNKDGIKIKPPIQEKNQNQSVNDYEKLLEKYGNFDNYLDSTDIRCKSLMNNEIYISAEGLVTPCCWTAGRFYKPYQKLGTDQIYKFVDTIDSINCKILPLRDIIDGHFFKNLEDSWLIPTCEQGKSKICAQKCGEEFDPFSAQWT